MRRLFVLLFTLIFLISIPATAFAAFDTNNPDDPSTNVPAPGQPYDPDALTDGDTQDNSIGNANRSGGDISNVEIQAEFDLSNMDGNNIIKSKNMRMNDYTSTGTQRTHGTYQNNTNSCASCHQTHTGAGKDLLIKKGVYNTCSACHDGTLGFYNVFSPSTAGTFGGTHSPVDGNPSVHLANGTLPVSVAPGFNDYSSGNPVPADAFDCAGCHAPHGSYSDRILHYSPNGMANISIDQKGKKLVGKTIMDDPLLLPAPNSPSPNESDKYVVFRGANGSSADDMIYVPQEAAGTQVVVVLKKTQVDDGTGTLIWEWKTDDNPWVAGFEHQANDMNTYTLMFTQFYNAADTAITEDADEDGDIDRDDKLAMDIRYGHSYAKGTAIADATKADIARAYVVKLSGVAGMNPSTIADFGGIAITAINPDIYDEQGIGLEISRYCGACHTDYMTHSTRELGDWIYRHSTDKDRFNCLKCHFAHGTDVMIMKDARDRDINYLTDVELLPEADAVAYLLDNNPSSALKRYTNMAVCWKCHSGVSGKSSKLMNNTNVWDDYENNPWGGLNPDTGIPLEANWTNNSWE